MVVICLDKYLINKNTKYFTIHVTLIQLYKIIVDTPLLFTYYCIILYNFVELNQNKLIARNTQRCLLYHN